MDQHRAGGPEHFPDLEAFAWHLNHWQGRPVYASAEEMEEKFEKDFLE